MVKLLDAPKTADPMAGLKPGSAEEQAAFESIIAGKREANANEAAARQTMKLAGIQEVASPEGVVSPADAQAVLQTPVQTPEQ